MKEILLFRTKNRDMQHIDAVLYPDEDLCVSEEEHNAKKLVNWFKENDLLFDIVREQPKSSSSYYYILRITDPHAQTMAMMFFEDRLFHDPNKPCSQTFPGQFFDEGCSL